jgi:hypothetical protein
MASPSGGSPIGVLRGEILGKAIGAYKKTLAAE